MTTRWCGCSWHSSLAAIWKSSSARRGHCSEDTRKWVPLIPAVSRESRVVLDCPSRRYSSVSSPDLIACTRMFHSARVSVTRLPSSPMRTSSSLMSTVGQWSQCGQSEICFLMAIPSLSSVPRGILVRRVHLLAAELQRDELGAGHPVLTPTATAARSLRRGGQYCQGFQGLNRVHVVSSIGKWW